MWKKFREHQSRILLAALGAIVLIAGTGLLYHRYNKSQAPGQPGVNGQPTINYGPPTATEKQEGEQHKQDLIDRERQQNQNNPPGQKKTVTPTITFAGLYEGKIEVSAFIPGIYEEAGTCTLTATQGSHRLTREVISFGNVNNTNCQTFSVERSAFPATGSWQIVVSYSSTISSGTSTPKTVEV
jgi:hypothetical protein